MAKVLGISPKGRRPMQFTADPRVLLFEAVPPRINDNKKSWFVYAADVLKWTPRRVRAYWHQEVRKPDPAEIETLEQRAALNKAALRRLKERQDELRPSIPAAREGRPMAVRDPDPLG